MFVDPRGSVILLILAATILVRDVNALQCVTQTACSCHLADESFYDLSQVAPTSHLVEQRDTWKFSFLPCKNVKMTIDDSPSKQCTDNGGVSLCARSNKDEPFSLGTTVETKWNIPEGGDPQLILTHGPNTTRINLMCLKPDDTSFVFISHNPTSNQFNFVLSSPHVCRTHAPREGLSTGSVLVILLFVFSGVYLLMGALALRFFRGAIGWELIPNYDFWSGLPALVRDGVTFTFSGCKVVSYDAI